MSVDCFLDRELMNSSLASQLSGTYQRYDMEYTRYNILRSITPRLPSYYSKLAVGQSPTWIPDVRTLELFSISQWLIDELISLGCSEDDRHKQMWFWNRKSRSEEDLYTLAALTLNNLIEGKVDNYHGK